MEILEPTHYPQVLPLVKELPHHLAPVAILNGVATGQVYASPERQPGAVMIQTGSRKYLAGDPHHPTFNQDLTRLFRDEIYPAARARGDDAYILYYPNLAWQQTLEMALETFYPIPDRRQYYQFRAFREASPLPDGFLLRPITPELLRGDHLANLPELREEVVSEAASQAEFFQYRFGFCIQHQEALVAWCLSEYNFQDRCEIGIATVPEYQRRGLAAAVGRALVEHALSQGITQIGWDCWASNAPSAAAALKIGFELVEEYPVLFAFYEPLTNLAVNGNVRLSAGQYPAAVAWYARALAAGEAPSWVYWNAACANARIEEYEDALALLRLAIQHGFDDFERLRTSPHLAGLRETPTFHKLLRDFSREV